MDLVFSSVFLFLIFFPGFAFRAGYFTPPFSKGAIDNKFLSEIAYSIPIALVFHAIAILVTECITSYRFNIPLVGSLIMGVDDPEIVDAEFSNIKSRMWEILSYNITVILFAFFAGVFSKWIVRRNSLDLKFPILRFPNKWFYILSGEILQFSERQSGEGDFDLIFVDALVNTDEGTYLYTGELTEFHLNDAGGLESIMLRFPSKKKFAEGSTFKAIPGKFLLIGYEKIINLNIRYIKIEETTDPAQNQPPEFQAAK